MQREIHFEGRPIWAEIRLSALAHNLRVIQRRLRSAEARRRSAAKPQVLAVVKANAYGHGAVRVARALASADADWFGVTCSAEGLELRESGIRKPILLLTGFWPGEEKNILEHRLTPTVTRYDQLRMLDRAATRMRCAPVAFHLKIETGMNRLGMAPADLPRFASMLADCRHVRLGGIFTHFASSEVFSDDRVELQQGAFEAAVAELGALGVSAPLLHLANSAAIASRPSTWGTMVRPGLLLYGYHQSYDPPERTAQANAAMPLRPVLSLRSRLISVRDVAVGRSVGYNGRWTASRPSRIAVIAAGYADGIPRRLTNQGRVIIRGQFAPMIGTVSMDLVTVDVTDIPEARLGDMATIYGADGKASLWVSEVAQQLGTVTSDLCCALGQRVPRLYLP